MQLKDPVTESITSLKPSVKDYFDVVETREELLTYMYKSDDGNLHCMIPDTYEIVEIPKALFQKSHLQFLEDGAQVRVRMCDGQPVIAALPKTVVCTVAEVLDRIETSERR